jgi:peptidylprolyl isomerase
MILAAAVAGSLVAGPALAKPKKVVGPAPIPAVRDADWIAVDPDNLLVIDTTRGRIVAELYPTLAPLTVERIKTLARQHFYDGQTFFRVIDQFMAQTGDPTNTGTGGSTLPDLAAEFTFRRTPAFDFQPFTEEHGQTSGFVGAMPVGSQTDTLLSMSASGTVSGWGMFCPGVLGMARADKPDSANSQFFIIRQTSSSIDQRYTAFGRVLQGLEFVRLIKVGEPVAAPQDRMTRVRLGSDLPAGESLTLSRLDVKSPNFVATAAATKDRKGPDFTVCDLDVPLKGAAPAKDAAPSKAP